MIQIKNISIPKPCSQHWQKMDVEGNGRHCNSCNTTVVDFNNMTDNEIISYLTLNTHVCGRFEVEQLKRVNKQLLPTPYYTLSGLKKWGIAFGLLSSFSYFKANAQVKEQTIQLRVDTSVRSFPLGKVLYSGNLKKVITGRVTDDEGQPIPGVKIMIPATSVNTFTDLSGYYKLSVPSASKQFNVAGIGYETQVITIDTTDNLNYDVKLRAMLLGEVVVVKTPFPKNLYYKYIKAPLRRIFK